MTYKAFLFQDPDDQIFMPTVFEDVAFGPLNLGWTPENVVQSASKALEQVKEFNRSLWQGIQDVKEDYPV